MKLIEVNSPELEKEFIWINVNLYKNDPNYIRPLDKDIQDVFDRKKNKYFRTGELARWVLRNNDGQSIGRIAAFVSKRYKNKGDKKPVGGFGFFDCIHNQEAANILLDQAKSWLTEQGMEAMDGPINFGERDKWWGLLVEGFFPPLYGMNYNAPYYQQLLENYGCQVFYYQNCWGRSINDPLSARFYENHARHASNPLIKAVRADIKNLDKCAEDFCAIYNSAWAQHEGNKTMELPVAKKMFQTMKPVIDTDLVWFTYVDNKPAAMYISLPELNQAFKFLNGQFDWWAKLKFAYYRWRGVINKITGIIFGIVPEYQGKGLDNYMIVEAAKVIQHNKKYQEVELQWQGDFHPRMNNISQKLEFKLTRRLATFRYLFDRNQPFERHPII